jgi:hypothetical protein
MDGFASCARYGRMPRPRLLNLFSEELSPALADINRVGLDAILAASLEMAAVTASVHAFAAIMNERRGRKRLESWMTAAEVVGEPALRSFVTGLRADQEAVTNWVASLARPDPRALDVTTALASLLRDFQGLSARRVEWVKVS